MVDYAEKSMKNGAAFAAERVSGINDNMHTPHYHEFYELYYLESGQRYHLIDDNMYTIEGGQFLLFEPYMLHHSYGDKDVPFCRLVIYFRDDEIISENLRMILKGSSGAYKLPKDETKQFYQLINMINAEKQNPQQYSDEYCQSLLNTMLIILFRNKRQKMKLIQKKQISEIISYINANYMYELSITDIAGHFYISPFYLCREFKKYTNSTIIQYINKTRIINAQRMLYSTDDNITNISMNTGFSNVSHFGRVFKEITGSTPTSWRKRQKSFE
jgi:AraC-like DNA-binding protein